MATSQGSVRRGRRKAPPRSRPPLFVSSSVLQHLASHELPADSLRAAANAERRFAELECTLAPERGARAGAASRPPGREPPSSSAPPATAASSAPPATTASSAPPATTASSAPPATAASTEPPGWGEAQGLHELASWEEREEDRWSPPEGWEHTGSGCDLVGWGGEEESPLVDKSFYCSPGRLAVPAAQPVRAGAAAGGGVRRGPPALPPGPAAEPASESRAEGSSGEEGEEGPHGEPGPECSICLSELHPGERVTRLGCPGRHCFHTECIREWVLQHKASCPLCRRDAFEASYSDSPAREVDRGGDGGAAEVDVDTLQRLMEQLNGHPQLKGLSRRMGGGQRRARSKKSAPRGSGGPSHPTSSLGGSSSGGTRRRTSTARSVS